MYYRRPGFLAVVRLTSQHPPSLPSASSTGDTQGDFERETTCGRESGREGWGKGQIIRRRESLVLYNRLNALWYHPPYSEFLTPPNNYKERAGDGLTRKTGIEHPWLFASHPFLFPTEHILSSLPFPHDNISLVYHEKY
jgi:hypothetical protein